MSKNRALTIKVILVFSNLVTIYLAAELILLHQFGFASPYGAIGDNILKEVLGLLVGPYHSSVFNLVSSGGFAFYILSGFIGSILTSKKARKEIGWSLVIAHGFVLVLVTLFCGIIIGALYTRISLMGLFHGLILAPLFRFIDQQTSTT